MTPTPTLESALQSALQGDVLFDRQTQALYATDASNYRQVPIGVLIPRHIQDVMKAIEICRAHDAPILSRGTGTSLAGQCCNTAVILDYSKYLNKILEIDTRRRIARVEPGVILDSLRHQAEKYGLTFGPDPASHSRCTLGGMIGNNSCGVHAVAWGKTVDNVERLEVLTYEGAKMDVGPTSEEELAAIIRRGGPQGALYAKLKGIRDRYADLIRQRFPKIPRRVSGYNLDQLLPENGFHVARALVGSEGTCVATLSATLRLVESPRARVLLVLGYPTVYDAAAAVPAILVHKPLGLEGFDYQMVDGLRRYTGYEAKIKQLPPGQAWLLVEMGGNTPEEAEAKAQAVAQGPTQSISQLLCTPQGAADIWRIRESALAATAIIPGSRDRYEGWEDAAVPPELLPSYLRKLRALYDRFGYKGAFYGHFGDGCVHTRIDFDLDNPKGVQDFRRFLDEATDLVVEHNGSISGEHGDGQARAELLPKMFGPEIMKAFEEFKDAWDPRGKMNPGKLIRPRAIVDDLRYGQAFAPKPVETHFHYPDDQGSFARAALRCVGVGQCRREETGLMCPSYQVTHDEKHSTRGRAHLLFEMLKGETITTGWQSEEVKDAMDLCLSCKGCKSDCPTNVDMAAYKAEFLSHYYETRRRPLAAHLFGKAPQWLAWGAKAPKLANALTHLPGVEPLIKRLLGMDPKRQIPPLATETFHSWFNQRSPKTDPRSPGSVMLWPDTFMNYLEPGIGQQAVESLETLGYSVTLPRTGLCCGRPLYDFGFLDQAKKQLTEILQALAPVIMSGTSIVFLEPGCASVFRDELQNFFPKDPLARKLSEQSMLFSEFVGKDSGLASKLSAVNTNRSAILQTHCHQKSVMSGTADRALLTKLGYTVQEPEPGCCGMAGAFGFEKDHAEVSGKLGERALLPAIRDGAAETDIIASGFSCREQIRQGSGKRPQHVAEALHRALHSQ